MKTKQRDFGLKIYIVIKTQHFSFKIKKTSKTEGKLNPKTVFFIGKRNQKAHKKTKNEKEEKKTKQRPTERKV